MGSGKTCVKARSLSLAVLVRIFWTKIPWVFRRTAHQELLLPHVSGVPQWLPSHLLWFWASVPQTNECFDMIGINYFPWTEKEIGFWPHKTENHGPGRYYQGHVVGSAILCCVDSGAATLSGPDTWTATPAAARPAASFQSSSCRGQVAASPSLFLLLLGTWEDSVLWDPC